MISPDKAAEIRRLFFAEHWTKGTIATQLGVHRDVVDRVVGSLGPEPKNVPARPSVLGPFKPVINDTLETYPRLTGTRLYDMIVRRARAWSLPGTPDRNWLCSCSNRGPVHQPEDEPLVRGKQTMKARRGGRRGVPRSISTPGRLVSPDRRFAEPGAQRRCEHRRGGDPRLGDRATPATPPHLQPFVLMRRPAGLHPTLAAVSQPLWSGTRCRLHVHRTVAQCMGA